MAWTGLALGLLFSLVNAYWAGHLDGLVPSESQAPSANASETNAGSLLAGMSTAQFQQSWDDLVDANKTALGSGWRLEETNLWSPDSPTYWIPNLKGNLRIDLDDHGLVERATLSSFLSISEPGHEQEIADVLTAWQVLCHALDGPLAEPNCAEDVAQGLGFPFEVIQDWNRYRDPMSPGDDMYFVKDARNGVHWQLLIGVGGIVISAGTTPLG